MSEVEFEVQPGCNLKAAPSLIEKACQECGLRISSRATRMGMPGSIYWYVKRGMQPGVLELTLWEAKRRVWATTPPALTQWMEEDLPRLREAVETTLRTAVS